MSMPKFPMTRAGYAVLESELKHRIQTERARLVEEIQEAIADDTNLAENTEYQAAKAEQELNETRIAGTGGQIGWGRGDRRVKTLGRYHHIWRHSVFD